MGKLRRLKKLRRALRGTYSLSASLREQMDWESRQHAAQAARVEKFYEGAAAKMLEFELVKAEDAKNFSVGMSVSGPPEMFGLPPNSNSGACSAHQLDGAYDCSVCYPPREPVTVAAVDHETGTITLSTAAP
jgi:hypothetical protein